MDERDEIEVENVQSDSHSNLSALRDNIAKKGKNAYYYAHGHESTGPAWDGKEEPRLLRINSTENASKPNKVAKEFASYAWADEKKSVKLYVDFEAAFDLDDEDYTLTNTSTSFDFSVTYKDVEYKLSIPSLYAPIESVTVKKKCDKYVLALKKSEEASWFELKKK